MMKKRWYAASLVLTDIRIMGANAVFPAILMAVVILVSYYGLYRGSIGTEEQFLFLQTAYPPVCAWLSVFSQKHILEMDGGELYFSFPIGRSFLGPVRALLWGNAASVFGIACVFPIMLRYYGPEAWDAAWMLFLQCLLLSALGFGAMSVLKNGMLSMLAVIAYCVFFLFADDSMVPYLNMYMSSESIRAFAFFTFEKAGAVLTGAVAIWALSSFLYHRL